VAKDSDTVNADVCCSEIVEALTRRGLSPASDAEMVVAVRRVVRRLCARDVVTARILEKETMTSKCSKMIHQLTSGKVCTLSVIRTSQGAGAGAAAP